MGATSGARFRGAVMGYNRAEVDSFVERLESELDIQESRKKKWDQQIAKSNAEMEQLKNQLEAERMEKQSLLEQNETLNHTITELESQLRASDEEASRARREYIELKNATDASGINPKTIQDAILAAQRMSEIVLSEAQDKAEEIQRNAEQTRLACEEEGRRTIADAQTEAQKVTEEATKKCDFLQREYDRILMDVTGFKAELMTMYRRHMELLATLPEKKLPGLESAKQTIDVEFETAEEEPESSCAQI